MARLESEKLFLQHPEGHQIPIPCTHLVQQHPNGDTETVPCKHGGRQEHPGGDVIKTPFGEKRVPCIHIVPIHPNGDSITVPCNHIVFQHPEGHLGPVVPCMHPMGIVRSEYGGSLLFYTDNSVIQQAVMEAIPRLNTLGVNLLSFRPLQIFHRKPLPYGQSGSDNGFWSHYNPIFHSIQVMDYGQSDTEKLETIRHELGHALVGNNIVNHYAGGRHELTKEAGGNIPYALAMSEGWANFVALVLSYDPSQGRNVEYSGMNWENLEIPPNGKIEYCVGACLWDLFDTAKIKIIHTRFGDIFLEEKDEAAVVAFTEIFKVYSPSLQTIFNGPWIKSIWDFLDRLKANNEDNATLVGLIDEVALKNVGVRPQDT